MNLKADEIQLQYLESQLSDFAISTGLKVNFHKSFIISMNVSYAKMSTLEAILGCQIGSMPFTYLGLPMGSANPKFHDLTPIMDRIERRLAACSSLLSYSGRLQMVNSVVTPSALYDMCTIKLPIGVIENIDRSRNQCLWGDVDTKKGGNLAAWSMVQKPKNKGGLGVSNILLQNDALLLKHLNNLYANVDVPWAKLVWSKYYSAKVSHGSSEVGSLWWKDVQRLHTIFRGISRCIVGDGSSILF
jgi:hypothetical protein